MNGEATRWASEEEARQAPVEEPLPESIDTDLGELGAETASPNGGPPEAPTQEALGPGCRESHPGDPRATCRYCRLAAERAREDLDATDEAEAQSGEAIEEDAAAKPEAPCPYPEHRPSDWLDGAGARRCGRCDPPTDPKAPARPPPPGPGGEPSDTRGTATLSGPRLKNGAEFILDAPETVPAVWGRDGDVAWADGEPLMIAGPQGVGKTKLEQRLMGHRLGIFEGELIGLPVTPTDGDIFYIAADRPRQAARSMRRMVNESQREILEQRVRVWEGPLPFDLGRCERGTLAQFVADQCPRTADVYIDSMKDVAVKLSDDEVGSRVNAEIQELLACGIQVVENHHQRKAGTDNRRPAKLADVYGSVWLTAGCGSVLLLWGESGDPIVELTHLKAPAGEVGPAKVIHDHTRGTMALHDPQDLVELARTALGDGLTVRTAAVAVFGTDEPSENQIERVRAKLNRHPKLCRVEGSNPAAYRPKGAS